MRATVLSLLHRIGRAARAAPLETALGLAAVVVAVYVLAAPLASVRYPAMTDLPMHAAHMGAIRHYFDPSFHIRDQFELHALEVPYVSMYAIGAALMLVLPMLAAVKIAAFVMLALLPMGLAVMFHAMKKSPLLGLLGLGFAWGNLTHWGFLNFMGALGLFAMAVGVTLMLLDRPTRGRQIALALVLAAIFFTHISRYPLALAAVAGTAIVMYPATRRLLPVAAPLVPAAALFLYWWFQVRPAVIGDDLGPLTIHNERVREIPSLLTGAFTDPDEQTAFHRLVVIAVLVFAACLAARVLRDREPATARQQAWELGTVVVALGCTMGFLGLFLVLPMSVGLWWYVYPREATSAAFLLLSVCPDLPKPFALRAALVGAIAVGSIGITRVVVKNYAVFDRSTEDFYAITRQLPRAPKLLYLIYDHGGSTRTTTPYIHLPAYVQAEQGGWLSFHFAAWGTSLLRFRDRRDPGAVIPPPTPLRWEWTPHVFDLTRQGCFFDWFLVRRPMSADGLFSGDPTIERVDHRGSFWLYRRRPRQVGGMREICAPAR